MPEKEERKNFLLTTIRPRIWARLLYSIIYILILVTVISTLVDYKLLATLHVVLAYILFIALLVIVGGLLVINAFSFTNFYDDRITFLGSRFYFLPCMGTIRIDEIESVFFEQGRSRADNWVTTTIVRDNGTKVKWTMHFSDYIDMFNAMYKAMFFPSMLRGKTAVSLSQKQFLLQRVSEEYSSVEFFKNHNSRLPFTQWPKAEPFSLKSGDVLCVRNREENGTYFIFDKSQDFSNLCSFVNKHFSKSVRMGFANDGSLFTEEEAKWIAKEEHEDEIGCMMLFGAIILLLHILLFMLNIPKN